MSIDTSAIQKACELLGGQSALARHLDVKPPTVNEWVKGDRKVPAERCPEIERLTQGAVRCEDLRPDVKWHVLREQSAEPTPEPPSKSQPKRPKTQREEPAPSACDRTQAEKRQDGAAERLRSHLYGERKGRKER